MVSDFAKRASVNTGFVYIREVVFTFSESKRRVDASPVLRKKARGERVNFECARFMQESRSFTNKSSNSSSGCHFRKEFYWNVRGLGERESGGEGVGFTVEGV